MHVTAIKVQIGPVSRDMSALPLPSTSNEPLRIFTVLPGSTPPPPPPAVELVYHNEGRGLTVYRGDSLALLDRLIAERPEGVFDMIFADPPYFLSSGGQTCRNGKRACVDKGDWDTTQGPEFIHAFNLAWLEKCRRALKPNGTIFVSGTHHVILSVGFAMQQLGFKILNDIAWQKTNPPPNLGCRCFTHSTETLLWAAKSESSKHCFNYGEMKRVTGKQMQTVWRMSAPGVSEKTHGRHPTQKPLALLERCILAATEPGALVFDPFLGGGTTLVAAARTGRRGVGCDLDPAFADLAIRRLTDSGDSSSGLKLHT